MLHDKLYIYCIVKIAQLPGTVGRHLILSLLKIELILLFPRKNKICLIAKYTQGRAPGLHSSVYWVGCLKTSCSETCGATQRGNSASLNHVLYRKIFAEMW